ncbi:MAG: entry exclusion lipoprotein TrbK [Methylococcales bacterium]|nr:entry exclusion lipoprotein TrbK [Methylococcales bacterium]
MNNKIMLALILATLATAGCTESDDATPVVNNENCAIEAIKKIKNKAIQQEFAGLCVRRSITPDTLPTNNKKW